jgi:MFS family permease
MRSDSPGDAVGPPGPARSGRRVTRLYQGFQLCTGLLWWLPIFYVYQRDIGLSDREIFGIQSIYYTAFLLLDIPTGALADRFDYRQFLGGGAAALTLANVLPVVWPGYAGFLVHFLLIAFGNSLISGAGSAYLYEYLHRTGAGPTYRQAEGGGRAYSLVGRVACLPAAGVLMQWYRPAPYLLSAASTAIAVLIALRLPALPDTGPQPPARAAEPVRVAMRRAWRVLCRSRLLVLLMAQGIAIFTLVRICQANLFQPILTAKHLPIAGFGVVMGVTTAFEAAGAARPAWLRRHLGDIRAVFVLTVAMAGCLALVVVSGLAATVAVLCVFSLAAGVSFPIQRQLVNDAITDMRCRATLLSIESLLDRAVCALVIALLGVYLGRGAMNEFLVHVGVATVALMAVLAVAIRQVRRQPDRYHPLGVQP